MSSDDSSILTLQLSYCKQAENEYFYKLLLQRINYVYDTCYCNTWMLLGNVCTINVTGKTFPSVEDCDFYLSQYDVCAWSQTKCKRIKKYKMIGHVLKLCHFECHLYKRYAPFIFHFTFHIAKSFMINMNVLLILQASLGGCGASSVP